MNAPLKPSPKLDGVSLALLNRRFEGVARKMANTLLRTGRSGVLNIARDFSCCIVTADCELLVTNEGLPIHVLSGPDIMARVMKEFAPELTRGDAYLNNSPYHGCSHAADHTILIPVIDEEGVHRFTVLAKAHQADTGNSIPTTYHGSARDVYEEGALIFPSVKVQQDYQTNEDFVRMCRMRIRVPDQWWGDFLAALGAARIGEQEIIAMAEEIGWDTLSAFARDWLDYSERRMTEALRAMPAGEARRSSTHDQFPGTPPEGIKVNVAVSVDPKAARIAVDLADNIDCLPCGLNLSEACSRTAAMVGIFNSIDHTVPKNAGAFRRIDIALRENCVVGIPRHPTSTSVATTNVADRVANAVQAAIADIAEGRGMAECGAVIPPAVGVISGLRQPGVSRHDRRRGRSRRRCLDDDRPCRQCRLVQHRQRRARRAAPADPRLCAQAGSGQRGRRPPSRRAVDRRRVRPGRLRHLGRLCQRRRRQRGQGRARRWGWRRRQPVQAASQRRPRAARRLRAGAAEGR
jgi:N-methylhydantoinase B